MNRRTSAIFAVLLALATASVQTAAAQANPPQRPAGARAGGLPPQGQRPNGPRGGGLPAPDPASMTVQDIEQYFDMIVLNQARSQLQLTQEQFPSFRMRLQRLQNARRREQRQHAMLVRELNILLNAEGSDEGAIAAKLKQFDDVSAETGREVQAASASVDEVLSVRQRARFRVFSEMMERRKLELLARARQQGQPAPPPTGPQ